jgi:hypothetical protein
MTGVTSAQQVERAFDLRLRAARAYAATAAATAISSCRADSCASRRATGDLTARRGLLSQQPMNLAVGASIAGHGLTAKEELAAIELGYRPATSSIVQLLYHQHQRSTAPSPAPAKTGASVMPAF